MAHNSSGIDRALQTSKIAEKPGIGTAPYSRRGKSILTIAPAEPSVSAFEEGRSDA
jgi:hypothetical protein